jgi:hypothetical protein
MEISVLLHAPADLSPAKQGGRMYPTAGLLMQRTSTKLVTLPAALWAVGGGTVHTWATVGVLECLIGGVLFAVYGLAKTHVFHWFMNQETSLSVSFPSLPLFTLFFSPFTSAILVHDTKHSVLHWITSYNVMHAVAQAQLVEALRYKSEGRGFDSPCHWPRVDSASNRNKYQEYFLRVKTVGA